MMPSKLVVAVVAALIAAPSAVSPVQLDPIRDSQWHLAALRISEAQQISRGAGVTVAVIDSGVNATHPDLNGSVLPGTDLTGTEGDGHDDIHGHGTGSAGIISAHGRALGISPEARILPVRVGTAGGPGARGEVAAGISWAAENGADILCIAMRADDEPNLRAAVQRALELDIIVIAAVGNDSRNDAVVLPAAYEGVVAVAATDKSGQVLPLSNRGPQVVLAAPGEAIVSTHNDGGYHTGSGTSASTAIVAGVAALIRSKYPDLSAREVIHRMTATATDKGAPGRDNEYGYGIVDPVAALTANVPPLTTQAANPPPSTSSQTPIWLLLAIVAGAVIVVGLVVLFFLSRRRRS